MVLIWWPHFEWSLGLVISLNSVYSLFVITGWGIDYKSAQNILPIPIFTSSSIVVEQHMS
jgi:hypothetical protein